MRLAGQEVYTWWMTPRRWPPPPWKPCWSWPWRRKERLHVFLFGEAEVVMRLEDIAQGEERYHAIELLPYSESEAEEYLAQRLEVPVRGWRSLPTSNSRPFTSAPVAGPVGSTRKPGMSWWPA